MKSSNRSLLHVLAFCLLLLALYLNFVELNRLDAPPAKQVALSPGAAALASANE